MATFSVRQTGLMSNSIAAKAWFYILFLPTVMATLGLSIVFIAFTFEWGSEFKIPAPFLLGLFFAEVTMVVAGLGIVSFVKSKPRTAIVKGMGLWNLVILIVAGITGYYIFMAL